MPSPDSARLARAGDALALAAWAAFAAAPLAYASALGNAAQLALLFAALPLAVLACGARLATGVPLALPAGGVWVCATLVAFWGLASRMWAEYPLFVGHASYPQIQALFVLLIAPQLARGRAGVWWMAVGYLGAAVAMATGFLGVRALAGDDWHAAHGFRWPGGNPNHTAMLLVPPALLAVLLAGRAWRGGASLRRRAGMVAVAALLLVAVGVSRSSGAAGGLGVGLVALAWTRGGRLGRRFAATALWVGFAALVTLAIPGVARACRTALADRGPEALAQVASGVERSVELRQLLAAQAIDTWRQDSRRVWLGVGIGGYLPAAISHRDDRYLAQGERSGSSSHPHNASLLRLVEQGAVGLALYAALLFALLRRTLGLARRPGVAGVVGAAGLASLAGLLAHGQVERFLDDPLGLLLWWAWAGVVAAPWEDPPPREAPRPWAGLAFGAVPAAALALIYAGFVARPLAGRLDAREAWLVEREARGLRDPEARHRMFVEAAAIRESAVARLARVGEGETSLAERRRWGLACFEAGRSSEALEILADLELRCPGYDSIEWNLASMAVYAGRFELARGAFARFFARCPTEPAAYEEWWSHRAHLADPAMNAWVLDRLGRGIEILHADDPRRAQLETLVRRIVLQGK